MLAVNTSTSTAKAHAKATKVRPKGHSYKNKYITVNRCAESTLRVQNKPGACVLCEWTRVGPKTKNVWPCARTSVVIDVSCSPLVRYLRSTHTNGARIFVTSRTEPMRVSIFFFRISFARSEASFS